MRHGLTVLFALSTAFSLAAPARAADVGYYFNLADQLVDLPYPGTEFYGEVDLTLLALNNLLIEVNAYTSPGETDYQGNFITSPLVAGPNFGIQTFGVNSELVADEAQFDAFVALYDIVLPDNWTCSWGGVAGELGKFELWDTGTGGFRQDPLIVEIVPKPGAVIPAEFEIDSVFDFVELCPQGTYFAMHAAGFTTDPSYWETGYLNPVSAWFAVGPAAPEPGTVLIALMGLIPVVLRRKRR